MKKYIQPNVKIQTITIDNYMVSGSILGGDTTTQLGKERDDWDEFGSEF